MAFAQKPAARSSLDRAEDAIARGDYAAAEPLLKSATAADSKDYRAWYDLGFTESALNRPAEAVDAYRKSVELNPKVFESNLNLGVLLAKQNSPDAEKYLRAATALKPTQNAAAGQARAWLALGSLLDTAKPQEAIAAYREAARLDPKNPSAPLYAAILLEKQKDFAAAEAEFKRAAALDPKSSEALAGLVNIYMETRRLPDAEAALRQYLQLDPHNNTARVQLGRVLAAEGRAADAIPELEAALQQTSDPAALRELAGLHAAAKQYDKAEIEYRAALQSAPNDPDLHFALGTVLMNARKFDLAQPELIAAVKLKPDLPEAYANLAIVAAENKNYPLALQALDARAKFVQDSAATYFLRATAYDHLHDAKNATENYKQFLAVAGGKYPDQEWQARHRLIAIDPKSRK